MAKRKKYRDYSRLDNPNKTCPHEPTKLVFDTKQDAYRFLQRTVRVSKRRPDYVYTCEYCPDYHVGTRTRTKSKIARSAMVASGKIRPREAQEATA
jgi:hypothetical protein